ncbi:MAG: PQQ-dependent sugar dehydrogenase, partial [Ignavibacteriales bacterium]|nr:PQQ-dependent sugar dehydrogenase [Ignavibacteriales bacterium]
MKFTFLKWEFLCMFSTLFLTSVNSYVMKFFRYLFFFCFCFFSFNLFAQTQANFDIIDAFPNLPAIERPVDIQNAGDGSGRLFVASQTGKIFVFNAERSVQSYSTFLDISSKVTTAFIDGFLGFTFHPDFAQNGFFYVDYTAPNPFRTVISRFKVSESNPDAADTTSEFIIMEIPLPPLSAHNGGQLAFGPDGYLYI